MSLVSNFTSNSFKLLVRALHCQLVTKTMVLHSKFVNLSKAEKGLEWRCPEGCLTRFYCVFVFV